MTTGTSDRLETQRNTGEQGTGSRGGVRRTYIRCRAQEDLMYPVSVCPKQRLDVQKVPKQGRILYPED